MINANYNYLNVPISQETIKHFNDYITLTGIEPTMALELAINRLTSLYWADEGFPKKAVINISGKGYPCWILGEAESCGMKCYRVLRGTSVETCRANQVEIQNN